MGIKDLWTILLPYCEQKPLYELHGKIVAIDLAGWVCESLCVVNYEVHPRFYLRNLFFRTCYLLLAGVTPVFVLEGEAPTLKYQVIGRRNDLQQFKGAKPKLKLNSDDNNNNNNKGRTRFNYVLKQCENLLNCLGLPCVQATGEAEAYCAYLNCAKLVDAVISQDSDCFAYGAEIVYRNFSISNQRSEAAQNGSVDVYNMKRIGQELNLGQQKIIAMALLCGCDYCPDGIEGVGKDTVLKLFQLFSDDEILERLHDWRRNPAKYLALEETITNKQICTNCGHLGKLTVHTKKGCIACNLSIGCDGGHWKDKRDAIKIELQIRKKSLLNENFPSNEIIQEFLHRPKNFPETLNLKWKQPNLVKFMRVIGDLLQWNEIYSFQKLLPLLTRWQCINKMNSIRFDDELGLGNSIILPKCIKKRRTLKGNSSYEIIWQEESPPSHHQQLNDVIPQEQIDLYLNESPQNTIETLWTTIEPCNLFEPAYPQIVIEFQQTIEQLKKQKKKKPSTKKRSKKLKSTTLNGSRSSSVVIPTKKKKNTKQICIKTNKQNKENEGILNDMSGILTEIDAIDKEMIKPLKKLNKKPKQQQQQQQQQMMDKYLIKNKNTIAVKDIKSNPTLPDQLPKNDILNLSEFSFNSLTDYDLAKQSDDITTTTTDSFNMTNVIEQMVLNAGMINPPSTINELNGNKLRYETVDINRHKLSNERFITDEFRIKTNDVQKTVTAGSSQIRTVTNSTASTSTPILISKFLNKHKIRNSNLRINNDENLSPIKRQSSNDDHDHDDGDGKKKSINLFVIDKNIEEFNVSHFFINDSSSMGMMTEDAPIIDEFEQSIHYINNINNNNNNTFIDFDEFYGLN